MYTIFRDDAVGVGTGDAPDEQGEGYTCTAGVLGDISDVSYKNHGWASWWRLRGG